MTSIETNLKTLAKLQKKKLRIEKTLSNINAEITKQQVVINKQVSDCGVDTSFS